MTVEDSIPANLRRRLSLPSYRVIEAARYTGAKPSTISSWHYRYSRLGPVLPGKEPRKPLSYLQLTEAAFVADFRSSGISMTKIRKARDYLMERFHAEYPFAQLDVRKAGAHIVRDLIDVEPDGDLENLVIADANGQLGWASIVERRFEQFEYFDGLALRWHPRGGDSSVAIDARISFGAPTIKGVPTWAIRGRELAGESVKDIAEDFNIEPKDVEEASAFELVIVDPVL